MADCLLLRCSLSVLRDKHREMPQTPHTRRASPDSGLQPVLDTSGGQEDESPSRSTGSSEFMLLIRISVHLRKTKF